MTKLLTYVGTDERPMPPLGVAKEGDTFVINDYVAQSEGFADGDAMAQHIADFYNQGRADQPRLTISNLSAADYQSWQQDHGLAPAATDSAPSGKKGAK